MKIIGFNAPASLIQWAKGAAWAVVGAATGVLIGGEKLQWHSAGTAALIAFFAYLHNSAPKETPHV